MSEIELLIGKKTEIQASEKGGNRQRSPLTQAVLDAFPLLKTEETIKLPIKGIDKKKVKNKATSLIGAIRKQYPSLKCGAAIREDFIYLFQRGAK